MSSLRRFTGRFFSLVIEAKPVPKSSKAISTPSDWKLRSIFAMRSGSSSTAYSVISIHRRSPGTLFSRRHRSTNSTRSPILKSAGDMLTRTMKGRSGYSFCQIAS